MLANHTNLDRALAGWGDPLPAWIKLLADACDRASQAAVAATLGASGGYVSRVLNNRYPGDLAEAERQVRAAFGAERVCCPLFGDMSLRTCIKNRRRAAPANWAQVQLARACPDCPNNTDREEN